MRTLAWLVVLLAVSCRGPGTQQRMCPDGYEACGVECIDLQHDAMHCGACDHACATNEECAAGMCQPICGAGQHACNGACVSNDDVAHCGALCTPCPVPAHSVATCDGTTCGAICDPTLRYCGGTCATCPAGVGTKCSGSQCVSSGCPKGQHLCDGECVDENGGSCGDSCLSCPAPPANAFPVCLNGGCEYLCRPGNRWCASGCCAADFMEVGGYHSCTVTPAGAVTCWGRNEVDGGSGGALGDGTLIDHAHPTPVAGLTSGLVAVQGGELHTCAMDQFGAVKCWGYAGAGRLGDGSMSDKLTPMAVSGLGAGSAIVVSAGGTGGCVVSRAGEVRCWGENAHGEAGDGTTMARPAPVLVGDLGTSVVDVTFGGQHACALLRGGFVRCWGDDTHGQLGDGTVGQQPRPVPVPGLTQVVRVSAGEQHTCAIRDGGEVWCWGDDSAHQLGPQDGGALQTAPARVGVGGAVEVSAGGSHTCALIGDGGVLCWGANGSGQLGDGSTNDHAAPLPVVGLSDGTSISAGHAHTCARTRSGTRCWGNNAYGQLGDGTSMNRSTPVMAQ